jgi:phosphate starvation-inducible PhoH-like protein
MVNKKNHTKQKSHKNTTTFSLSGDKTPYVFQRDKIDFDLKIRDLPWTEKQKAVISLVEDKHTKVVFLNGPAGTSKSLLAVYCALKLLSNKKISEIVYIRSIIESATRSLGSLPGEAEDKFKPFAAPMVDKMEELLRDSDIKRLFSEERVKPTPVNYIRGASYNVNCIIADEMQNAVFSEIQTIMTRIGQFSKVIICGDPAQSDLTHGKSGFLDIYNVFNNEEAKQHGIFCVEFTEEDILRSEICKFIVKKFTELKQIQIANQANKKQHNTKDTISTCPTWSPQKDLTNL